MHQALFALAAQTKDVQSKNPILPSGAEIVWGLVSFVVLFVLLWKFALPPVTQMMKARTERIRTQLEEADKVKGEAQTILDEYQRQLADARSQANRIIEEARQQAEQLRHDMMRRAEEDVNELRARQSEELRLSQERALTQLRGQVRDLALDLAEKVVVANLDRDRNLALVDQFIAELSATNGRG